MAPKGRDARVAGACPTWPYSRPFSIRAPPARLDIVGAVAAVAAVWAERLTVLHSLSKHESMEARRPLFVSRGRPPRREVYADAGVEPALNDLLTDPLTAMVMRRDGVRLEELRALLAQTRAVLKARC